MAYDYGIAIGKSASETLKLPIAEIAGYYAYMKIRNEAVESG
jgi:hypothetical protein